MRESVLNVSVPYQSLQPEFLNGVVPCPNLESVVHQDSGLLYLGEPLVLCFLFWNRSTGVLNTILHLYLCYDVCALNENLA